MQNLEGGLVAVLIGPQHPAILPDPGQGNRNVGGRALQESEDVLIRWGTLVSNYSIRTQLPHSRSSPHQIAISSPDV